MLSRISNQEHIPHRNMFHVEMVSEDSSKEVWEFRESGAVVNTGRPHCAGTGLKCCLALRQKLAGDRVLSGL